MTAEIVSFGKKLAERNRARKKENVRPNDSQKNKSPQDIFLDVIDDIMTEWEQAAKNNRLSDYIAAKLPQHVRGPKFTDYVNDLNAISSVEQKLGMKVAFFSTGSTRDSQYGWLAVFFKDDQIFSTPPNMASEGMARSLNLLLYVYFEHTLETLGKK